MEHGRGILFDAEGLAHLGCKAAHEPGISIMDAFFFSIHFRAFCGTEPYVALQCKTPAWHNVLIF